MLTVCLMAAWMIGALAQPPECSDDSHCQKNYFCVADVLRCEPCLNCNVYEREPSKHTSCVTSFTDCGDCLKGYVSIISLVFIYCLVCIHNLIFLVLCSIFSDQCLLNIFIETIYTYIYVQKTLRRPHCSCSFHPLPMSSTSPPRPLRPFLWSYTQNFTLGRFGFRSCY